MHIEHFRWRLVQGEIAPLAVFTILGSTDPTQEKGIYCIGISVSPTQLSWGVWPALTPSTKTVLLSNESLIPAKFVVHTVFPLYLTLVTFEPLSFRLMRKPSSQWTQSPLSPPQERSRN